MPKNMILYSLLSLSISLLSCSSTSETVSPAITPITTPQQVNEVDYWLTNGAKNTFLQKQTGILTFGSTYNVYPSIEVDATQTYQTIDGFGFTLTGGSAQSINLLNTQKRKDLLQELFGKNDNSISISYLRISIGASDLNAAPFSYNDLASGQTDVSLSQFHK
jgi:glucosylceramidase